ncbi:hypothetical protein BH11ARM2_BH11ARM2_22480 [soil metagenome]
MNPNEEPIVPTPGEPVVVETAGEHLAENYVHNQLIHARRSLMITRFGTIALVLVTGLYLGYLTQGFRSNLEPTAAAEITRGLVMEKMNDAEPQFASYIREEVPKCIRQAPDYAKEQLPHYRENIEDRVESDLRSYAQTNSDKLSKQLSEFLTAHKDQVNNLIEKGQDAQGADEMGADLEKQFRTFLTEQPVAGDTLQARLDNTLDALNKVQARTAQLAANKGLTPDEQKTRRAIALLMRRISGATNDIPKLNVDAIKQQISPPAGQS